MITDDEIHLTKYGKWIIRIVLIIGAVCGVVAGFCIGFLFIIRGG